MYLKSIEVQGFKSFANKIKFEFHNGITGIVGPNGSGKSNVADAVRWVLGEQRAKQLRGSSMQDVIFAGTENRKPLGFAYVAITLDNSDKSLAIDFDEVTVARRVYRSGESEYLINGTTCRLKDVHELFYDTGIGKEGYSIIGQGQIEKILSDKPEDRRELFDEAAGIVKFKRRKNETIKKLEDERLNLERVNDILGELELQVGPLKEQSDVAKIYLAKKEELKNYDLNMFLLEDTRIKKESAENEEKREISEAHLDEVKQKLNKARDEYDSLEKTIEENNSNMEKIRIAISDGNLQKERNEGRIGLLNEQINGVLLSVKNTKERSEALKKDIETKTVSYEEYKAKALESKEKLDEAERLKADAESYLQTVNEEIENLENKIKDCKAQIIKLLNERGTTKAKFQHYDTMLEQIGIRKSQLDNQYIKFKSDEEDYNEKLAGLRKELEDATGDIVELDNKKQFILDSREETDGKIREISEEINRLNGEYHKLNSKLETVQNMAERYEGYGNSIKKVMENKDSNPGIIGVVADIVKVDKKFETAIETALGGSIQNIVTKDEKTAKEMIALLKETRAGRATFLPLSDINTSVGLKNEDALKEKGVLGLASRIVKVDKEFEGLANYLLSKVIVADTIDNALALAKKYNHSLRIVTLEGELLSPGGSLSGGQYKNSSNLLGRRREIEELEDRLANVKKKGQAFADKITELEKEKAELEKEAAAVDEEIKEKYILQNTIKMNIEKVEELFSGIEDEFKKLSDEKDQINSQIADIKDSKELISLEISMADKKNTDLELLIAKYEDELKRQDQLEREYNFKVAEKNVEYSTAEQRLSFDNENLARVDDEIAVLEEELLSIENNEKNAETDIDLKKKEIDEIQAENDRISENEKAFNDKIKEFTALKEEFANKHKGFFDELEELNKTASELEKDVLRLDNQKEKLETTSETLKSYIWDEYEITPSEAKGYRDEALKDLAKIKKHIHGLKDDIKGLGNVNVNAIEEYKEKSERYEFLKTQHDDLITTTESLEGIIAELEQGMKKQFDKEFGRIQAEFDVVFKELFGGGKGTIELVDRDDVLESGIRIIAQPPGKKLQNMMQLSGGEKSLTAIALLFAIQNLKPSPFCLLDEIEAALDESNVGRFAEYLGKLTKSTQFIIITHRRGTMNAADRLYGITMQEKGISALVSVDLIEDVLDEEEKEMTKEA